MKKPHQGGDKRSPRPHHSDRPHHSARPPKGNKAHTKQSSRPQKIIEGTLVVLGRGGGIVKCEEYKDGIRVFENDMNMALHGDEVKVVVTGSKATRPSITTGAPTKETVGRITEIVLRAKTQFTGVLAQLGNSYILKASDPKMYANISIQKDMALDARPGDRVYVEMIEWKNQNVAPIGRVVRVLGKPGEHETEMQAIALERGFTEAFPDEVLVEA